MFRLAMSHLQAILTYCFDQKVIINEMLARYGILYGCTVVASKHFIYNNCLVKAISSYGLKVTYCESKHVVI
jgi:hypothetical protein